MKLVIIAGSKGTGKSTIGEALLAGIPELELVESASTREPRYAGERGHQFLTPEEFRNGGYEFAGEVLDKGYLVGYSPRDIEAPVARGRVPLLVSAIEPVAKSIVKKYADAFMIYFSNDPYVASERAYDRDKAGPPDSRERVRTAVEGGLLMSVGSQYEVLKYFQDPEGLYAVHLTPSKSQQELADDALIFTRAYLKGEPRSGVLKAWSGSHPRGPRPTCISPDAERQFNAIIASWRNQK
jgi:guanylate kinase